MFRSLPIFSVVRFVIVVVVVLVVLAVFVYVVVFFLSVLCRCPCVSTIIESVLCVDDRLTCMPPLLPPPRLTLYAYSRILIYFDFK